MKKLITKIAILVILLLALVIPVQNTQASTEATFYTTDSDGFLWATDTVYSVVHNQDDGETVYDDILFSSAQNLQSGGWWYIARSFVYFDTSSIPDIAVIESASLWLYGKEHEGNGDLFLVIQDAMPTYPHDPMVLADYDHTHFSGEIGNIKIATEWSDSDWNELDFFAGGLSSINKTGYTKLTLRLNYDRDSNATSSKVNWWAYENGAATKPKLVVNYTVPSTVTTQAADDITSSTATLHGTITDIGSENCDERGFDWDTDSGAPYTYSWTEEGSYGVEAFEHGITGLDSETTHYFRAKAHNEAGWSYGGELNFDTPLPLPSSPTNFTITQVYMDVATLTWTLGDDAEKTVIRVKKNTYPSSPTDGWSVYDDTGTTIDDDGLNLEVDAYYYRAWSHNATGYSTGYAEGMIGGGAMLFIGFLLIPLALTIAGYTVRRSVLTWAGAGFWMVFGAYCYTQYSVVWDLFYSLFFMSMAMVLVCALEPLIMKERKEFEDTAIAEESDDDELERDFQSLHEEMSKVGRLLRGKSKPKKEASSKWKTK